MQNLMTENQPFKEKLLWQASHSLVISPPFRHNAPLSKND
ncbi:hypothetical protein AC79_2192 [Escherichia coli 8-415-05_S4_C1]|nr:conserved hypothetical protein [Escherichia coli IHE3034]AWZ81921.1 hypothetical protein CSC38_1936 [Escherichia coli]EDV69339.1 conserved hypothetical protein [Escherichia coli F11]KDT44323.1 hypothetical protein AD15_2219 [Escherichia coli 3-105-05_S4_C2]KEJ11427.1 hypothetical protein AC79_2192 [Escherichia coli 8-415-05_S4_C1]KEJ31563.1 hypothetical protein AD36_2278 [Escherichia coli 8-415-05_S4_C3]KEJ38877.1 hypothetical protein AB65_2765 [Escherichia coli 2-460-02_S1_C3]KEN33183.1 